VIRAPTGLKRTIPAQTTPIVNSRSPCLSLP